MSSSKQAITEFLTQQFPQAVEKIVIENISADGAHLLYRVDQDDLRPGQTVSGPTLMAIADLALYVAIMGRLGLVAMAVTSNMNINFFRKPQAQQNIRAEC
ncbi:MAG: PaaI family thioesterase, partial [Acinetobacter sp.]